MKTYTKLLCIIAGILSWSNSNAQCTVQAIAQDTVVPCNGSTVLSVNGSGTSVLAFGENFNNVVITALCHRK